MLTPLQRRVFLVASASLLPLAILSGLSLLSIARDQERSLYRGSEDTVMALVHAIDAELKINIAALDALAVSPRLARGDFAAVREEALELLERRPAWLNLIVTDETRQLMNAMRPEDEPLPDLIQPETVARTFGTAEPVIGQVRFSEVLGRHVFAVQVPYQPRGAVRHVLAAVIRPDSLLPVLQSEAMVQNGVIVVLDDANHVVARSRNHEQYVGRSPSRELQQMLASDAQGGRGVTHTLEGELVYTVFRRSEYSGWTVALGIPRDVVDVPQQRAYFILGGAVLLSVLSGLALALLVGRTIVRPMRELERQALLAGSGHAPAMPNTRLPEVQQIARALSQAHATTQAAFQREHEARVAAETASKAKDEFLAMLGHELRNPLSAITNAAQLIDRRREDLDAGSAAASGIIVRQARHLARLTDDLLDAGRVILGKISLTRATLDLAQLTRHAVEELRGMGRLSGHQLHMRLEPAPVHADATRIEQIIVNLLTNALKYTPEGGHVTVATRVEKLTAIFEVQDDGIGLEPELLPRVFDLFVQGERALDRSQGGLGIGLTLVKRLVELHGGSVSVHSEGVGRGARFQVCLPLAASTAQRDTSAEATAPATLRRVVLIEDNDDARTTLRMLLEAGGHTVLEAADGPSGLALLQQHADIDIAFIDIGLPGISGFDIAAAVRAARRGSIRLVAMSGYGAPDDLRRGVDAGFDAYLVKPADLARVEQELQHCGGPG